MLQDMLIPGLGRGSELLEIDMEVNYLLGTAEHGIVGKLIAEMEDCSSGDIGYTAEIDAVMDGKLIAGKCLALGSVKTLLAEIQFTPIDEIVVAVPDERLQVIAIVEDIVDAEIPFRELQV